MRAAACLDRKDALSWKRAILYEKLLILASENIIGDRSLMVVRLQALTKYAMRQHQCCTGFEGVGKEPESVQSFQSRQVCNVTQILSHWHRQIATNAAYPPMPIVNPRSSKFRDAYSGMSRSENLPTTDRSKSARGAARTSPSYKVHQPGWSRCSCVCPCSGPCTWESSPSVSCA